MRSFRLLIWVLIVVAALATQPLAAFAQVSYKSSDGLVEVLGLEKWTLKMLRDSVQAKYPGLELHDAACMVYLRESLGFADAEVLHLFRINSPDSPMESFHIIKLVEPQSRDRVRWLTTQSDTFTVLRPGYAPVLMAALDTSGTVMPSTILWPLQFYGRSSADRAAALAKAPPVARADALRLWTFLENHKTDKDFRTALSVLRKDGAHGDRMVAAAILANFPQRDSAWYALTDALRDPHQIVGVAAATVLFEFPARPIDWSGKTETLRLLVGGTNVAASHKVFAMLAATGISPSLARVLVRNNGTWVLAHLRAKYPGASTAARSFLVTLNAGVDLGPDSEKWARWIRGL